MKKLNRMPRLAACIGLCLSTLLLGGWNVHGYSPAGDLKRTVLNANNVANLNDYAFINFFQEASGFVSPFNTGWASGIVWSSQYLDTQGYPCTNQVTPGVTGCTYGNGAGVSTANPGNGRSFGGSFSIPASTNYSGVYCLQGYGTGTISLGGSATWTESPGACGTFTGTYNKTSNANWTVSDETWAGWCIPIAYSGTIVTSNGFQVTATDTNSTGHYIKGLALYQLSDQTDFQAGKIFRSAYKAQIVNMDPEAIRVMNWSGGNSAGEMNFTDRPTPLNTVGYSGLYSPVSNLLPYGASSGSNQVTISSVTGTPASMTHGERVYFRAGSASARTVNGNVQVSSVSQTSGTVTVTTSTAHGFADGDIIITFPPSSKTVGSGMSLLNFYPATINTSGCGTTCYTFSFSGTVSGCASTGACNASANQFMTLNVGSRGTYPLTLYQESGPYSWFGTFVANSYYQFCYDARAPGQTDGSGNWVYGVWFPCSGNEATGAQRTVPIEIQVAFVNELNAMSPTHPISLFVTMPPMGVICYTYYCDPNGTASTDWPVNALNVYLNGANGYSGLNSPALLYVQYGNELWNGGDSQADQMGFYGSLPNTGAPYGLRQQHDNRLCHLFRIA